MTYRNLDEDFSLELSKISEALQDLRNVNHLAQDYLHIVEKVDAMLV